MTPNLTYLPATVCALLNIEPPRLAAAPPADAFIAAPAEPVERLLIYAPDAIGCHLLNRFPQEFNCVRNHAPQELRLNSVMPSVTPVCFASMFTGAMPDMHGLQRYEKPQLKCDTLFDALHRAGKRVAIVTVADSSIDHLFRGSSADHYAETYDPHVSRRALQLIAGSEHDLILAYHQQYDDLLHLTAPFSPECLAAFRLHVASFERLAMAVKTHWTGHNYGLAFTPDHGAHFDADKGIGMHGTDQPADMELAHFWGFGG